MRIRASSLAPRTSARLFSYAAALFFISASLAFAQSAQGAGHPGQKVWVGPLCAFLQSAQGGWRPLCAFLQETPQETAILDAVTRWKIINTALFVIGLGWLLAKYAPRFFNARSADIQKAIQEATGLRIQAEFRHSEIDRKMASLADEIKRMREQAAAEMERAHQRVRHETDLEIEHIHHNTQAEIEALRKEATDQLRRHTAQLALTSAERRLRDRFAAEDPTPLIDDFIRLVQRGRN